MRCYHPHELGVAAAMVAALCELEDAPNQERLLSIIVEGQPGHEYALRGIRALPAGPVREAIRPIVADARHSAWTPVVRALGWWMAHRPEAEGEE